MAEIIKFYERGFDFESLTVQWNLGNTCNYSCEYCPKVLHTGDRSWVELPLIEHTILKIKEKYPNKKLKLEFLGGEITLYRDFIPLMQFCKENKIQNMIFTNASRTFRHWNLVTPYIDRVLMTYHPMTTDKDHFRSIIKLFEQENVKYFVHLAMTKDLFWDTAEYAAQLQEDFPNSYITMTLMMDKENNKNYNGYYYDYSLEQIDYVMQNDKGAERYIAEFDDGGILQYNLNQIKGLNLNYFKNYHCGYHNSLINIDAFGNASTSLCRQKTKINIFDDNLDDLFRPHLCRSTTCDNPSDLRILKIKNI